MKWLTWEGAATMGFNSITESGFLAAYALLMGANNFQIGILAALPFMVQPTQILMIVLVERLKMRKAFAVLAWASAQAVWVPIALIPVFIETSGALSISALLGLVALRSLLASARNANFNSWVRDLVPAGRLGSFYSRRLTLATVAAIVFGLSASFFVTSGGLKTLATPEVYGYTIALLAGVIFIGMAGPIFMMLVPEPLMHTPVGGRPSLADNLTRPFRDRNFRQLMNFLFFRGFTANLAIPFFAVYMLQRIGLPLTAVIALTVLSQLSNMMFLRVWGPMSDRMGSKIVLSVCTSLLLIVILGWTFTTLPDRYALTIPLLVILHVFAGIAIAGINVTTQAIGMKLAPRGNAAPYLAGASLATNLGAGLAPLVGGRFADFFSVRAFSVSVEWIDPRRSVDLPAFSLTGHDFLFAVSFMLGLVALNTLATIREDGEATREEVMDELMAGAADMTRSVSSVPGLRLAAQFPYSYLRHVPGVDVAIGVTAYQLASTTRAATTAAGRGATSAEAIARTASEAVRSATGPNSRDRRRRCGGRPAFSQGRPERGQRSGSERGDTRPGRSHGSLSDGGQVRRRLGERRRGSRAWNRPGSARGQRKPVQGGAWSAGRAWRSCRPRSVSPEAEMLESFVESALDAAGEIGPEAVDEVRRAIRSATEDPG